MVFTPSRFRAKGRFFIPFEKLKANLPLVFPLVLKEKKNNIYFNKKTMYIFQFGWYNKEYRPFFLSLIIGIGMIITPAPQENEKTIRALSQKKR